MTITLQNAPDATEALPEAELFRPLTPVEPDWLTSLSEWFGVSFASADGQWWRIPVGASWRCVPVEALNQLASTLVERGRPEIFAEADPVVWLAIPRFESTVAGTLAIAPFITRQPQPNEDIEAAAALVGMTIPEFRDWSHSQAAWPAETLLRMARLAMARLQELASAKRFEQETIRLTNQLSTAYEEVCLLYNLIQSLRLSSDPASIGELALKGVLGALPGRGLALMLLPDAVLDDLTQPDPADTTYRSWTTAGHCPLDEREFAQLLEHVNADWRQGARLLTLADTQQPGWPFPHVRQIAIVPLTALGQLLGWLAAFDHTAGRAFGAVEANMLASVATILAVHFENLQLYREQSDLFAGIVHALTSAIDAKDTYTCGHSDRVARIAVRLGQELGCDTTTIKTLYLSGLLHDIGKIGVKDDVLRKPGTLTPEEFAHIKLHPEIGYRILVDLKNLQHVLPAVRHHHEAWSGHGYPQGLAGEAIPFTARVIAVADAYDAMFSNRPYRPGLPDAKVLGILRDGAGTQWDANVVDALMRAIDDVRRIVAEDWSEATLLATTGELADPLTSTPVQVIQ
jgi:HD-GYP domain-containing protein (c-di-GMP phosphodiesterase class II)